MFSKNEKNVSLEILLDDDFNGMMYGLPEESLGCKLKGKVILNNRKLLSAKYLSFVFHGRINVACGPPMSSSRPEYSEVKTIFRKEYHFHNSAASSNQRIPIGIHEYCFDIDLPGYLPNSFKGARGKIEYCCNAVLSRPMFHNDLVAKKIINIKRCIIDGTLATQAHNITFSEGSLGEKVRYELSTPIMSIREGGLVQSELTIKSMESDTIIEAIEYGLKEQIHYQTTGEEATDIIANVDEERFPLGKRRIKLDPDAAHFGAPIPINFRLCPWVNCDVSSQLININHKLSFAICISETINADNEHVVFGEENRRNSRRNSRSFSMIPLGGVSLTNNSRVNLRSSRAFSLSHITSPPKPSAAKVEKKRLQFEIPIIVTSKSCKPRTHPHHTSFDRPPAYAIVSMIPPPPEYTASTTELSPDE